MERPPRSFADSMPTGRVRRAVTPARLVVQGAAAAAMAKARVVRGGTVGDIVGDLAADKKLTAAALKIATQLGEMKGAAMKVGQILSFVDVGVLPDEYRAAFEALQADAPSMPYEQVEEVVLAELGARPDELFTFFSRVPIAAASIGQVHMAHIDDVELVVKIQYPGVAKAVEADLRNAALLALLARVSQKLLADLAGDIDTRAIVDEVRERVSEELDYRIEANHQRVFGELYRDDPEIDIPAVMAHLSTERVLTTEYVDGMRWKAALVAPQHLRDQWGGVIARFVESSLLEHGFVNLDPHPGNYLFHEDGRVTFIDFGACRRFSADELARLRRLTLAALTDDAGAMLDALVAAGLLKGTKGFDPELLLGPIRQTMEPILGPQPFRYSQEFVAEQIGQMLTLRFGRDELRLLRKLGAPPEYALLTRVTLGMSGILSQLESAVDFHALFDDVFAGDPEYAPFR
jgi:predicted unusual protein kinase regulating ubiquinone biosynthesis (AarF/ABC1/UbiB family)